MSDRFLDKVYGLETAEDARKLYDAWSGSYDAEVGENGYATPARLAEALARHASDRSAPILDFGCGTGLSGAALAAEGFTTIDGCDLSAEMLKGAADKGCYRRLWQVEANEPIPTGYATITATGVISIGAAPIALYDTLLAAVAPGGLIALSFNDHTLEDASYEAKLRARTDDGTTRLLFQEYGTHLPGIGLKSSVYVLEKL